MADFMDILNEDDEVESDETETTESATVSTDTAPEPEAEAVAEPVAEATEEVEAVAPDNGGYKQDERGVWHRPDGTIASKDEVAKLAAPVVEAAPEVEEAPKVETPATPFRYRAASATHELPGSSYDPATGKVTIEGEGVPVIRQAFNALHIVPQLQSENAKLQKEVQTRGPAEARAEALVNSLAPILEEADEEAALVKFFELRAKFPTMKHQAEIDYWKQRATQPQQESPYREEPRSSGMPAPEVAIQTTNEHLETLKLEAPEFRVLTDADWKQYGDSLAKKPYAFVRPATQADAEQFGVTVGELVFDTDALYDDLKSLVQRTSQAREAEANARKAKEAARFNAGQATKPVAKIPTQKRVPVAAGTPAGKKDWDSAIKDAWSNDDDDDMN